MRSATLVLLCVVVLSAASALWADGFLSVWEEAGGGLKAIPSWYGNSGLIVTPTAETLPLLKASAGWHRVNVDPDHLNVATLNVGVLPGLEIGGARVDTSGSDSEEIINAKYALPMSTWMKNPLLPEVAIGGWDLSDKLDRTYYVVVSKGVDLPTVGSLGFHLGYARNESNTGAMDGVFGGAQFSAFKYTTVMAEYDGDAFNAALRYCPRPRFGLEVGTLDGDLGFGLTYTSGF